MKYKITAAALIVFIVALMLGAYSVFVVDEANASKNGSTTIPERQMARCIEPDGSAENQAFPCVWDGDHSDGVPGGRSFIIRDPATAPPGWLSFTYISHDRAHTLWMPIR